MSCWCNKSGAETNQALSIPRVRAFHDMLVRYFDAMQRIQRCIEMKLPAAHFPALNEGDSGRFFMCRVADNMNPRIWTQDRELVLEEIRPGLFGVDPALHGGRWLSLSLVDTFVYGLDDKVVPMSKYLCPKALEGRCPGRKTLCLAKEKEKAEKLAKEVAAAAAKEAQHV